MTKGDVGWYPSAIVDSQGVVRVSDVDVINQGLLYINHQTLEWHDRCSPPNR